MKKLNEHDAIVLSSGAELDAQGKLVQLLKNTSVPDSELLANLGLFLTSKNLSRLLFFYEVYQRILPLHGVVMEFGVRWGQTLSLLSALRGILEPFNRHRKIIGFDTFAGFRGIDEKDGERCQCKDGSFSVPDNYQAALDSVLSIQEQLNVRDIPLLQQGSKHVFQARDIGVPLNHGILIAHQKIISNPVSTVAIYPVGIKATSGTRLTITIQVVHLTRCHL